MGSAIGDYAPDMRLDNGYLLDRCGPAFTVLAFGGIEGAEGIEDDLVAVVNIPPNGRAAEFYGAQTGDAILLRPDRFIAARLRKAKADQIIDEIAAILRGGR